MDRCMCLLFAAATLISPPLLPRPLSLSPNAHMEANPMCGEGWSVGSGKAANTTIHAHMFVNTNSPMRVRVGLTHTPALYHRIGIYHPGPHTPIPPV